MTSGLLLRTAAGAVALALFLMGCASSSPSSPPSPPPPLKSARQSCDDAVDSDPRPARCDDYVNAAKLSGDKMELFRAYSIRSVLWQSEGNLDEAIEDADGAIAAQPDLNYGYGWRAVLVGESGEYETALKQLRELDRKEPDAGFHADMAMLEYVAGKPKEAVPYFRSAAKYSSEVDHSEDLAAHSRFNAAIIQSELDGNHLASFLAVASLGEGGTILGQLWKYRVGKMSQAELEKLIPNMIGRKLGNSACITYFNIGHKNALDGNLASAKTAFKSAVARCSIDSFELHAARKWLKTLRG